MSSVILFFESISLSSSSDRPLSVKQYKNNTDFTILFPQKQSVWQNPAQEITNQKSQIYLKTTLPHKTDVFIIIITIIIIYYSYCYNYGWSSP